MLRRTRPLPDPQSETGALRAAWHNARLFQDTIVVLITCLLMTLFLLGVDMFWGWLLSLKPIGVLPPQTQQSAKIDPIQGKKVDW